MDIEQRSFVATEFRVEGGKKGKARKLTGHAAVFNSLSEDLGGFREQIAPGAFADAVTSDDVRALFNHDANFVLGRTSAKTLRLSEDSRGLAFECDLPETRMVRDLVVAPIERGDVSHMSFGFSVKPNGQDWAKDDEGRVVRTLKRVRLFDVSPVTFPAYKQTDVATRSFAGFCSERIAAGDVSVNEIRKLMNLAPLDGGDQKIPVHMNLARARTLLARV